MVHAYFIMVSKIYCCNGLVRLLYNVCFFRLAFAVYLIMLILFWLVIRLGAIAMVWLGVIQIMAIFFYGIIVINDPELKIPFGPEDEEILDPDFGWAFYLTLLTGLGCIGLGCVVWALDFFVPRKIAVVFDRTLVEDDEFFQEDTFEPEQPTLEEYGVSTRGTKRGTQRGLGRYRQTQRLPRSGSMRSQRGSQRFKNEAEIPLEDVPQGPISITVSTKT